MLSDVILALSSPPGVALITAGCLLLVFGRQALSRNRPSLPWGKQSRSGTVYLFRSRQDPALFKLGYTSRPATLRKRELEAKLGSKLDIVACLRMPHAWIIEQRCHAAFRARGWGMPWHPVLGSEWYRLSDQRRLDAALGLIEATSKRAERTARWKRSWPPKTVRKWEIGG